MFIKFVWNITDSNTKPTYEIKYSSFALEKYMYELFIEFDL